MSRLLRSFPSLSVLTRASAPQPALGVFERLAQRLSARVSSCPAPDPRPSDRDKDRSPDHPRFRPSGPYGGRCPREGFRVPIVPVPVGDTERNGNVSTPVTSSLNPWGPISQSHRVRIYQHGRTCEHPDCATILSVYNPSKYCSVHEKLVLGGRKRRCPRPIREVACEHCGATCSRQASHDAQVLQRPLPHGGVRSAKARRGAREGPAPGAGGAHGAGRRGPGELTAGLGPQAAAARAQPGARLPPRAP